MNPYNFLSRSSLALLILLLTSNVQAQSAPGDLDLYFGVNGVATINFPSCSNQQLHDLYYSNKNNIEWIYVLGSCKQSSSQYKTFFVARFNSYGQIDSSFGSSGIAFATFTDSNPTPKKLIVQEDGNQPYILVVGSTQIASPTMQLNFPFTWKSTINGLQGTPTYFVSSSVLNEYTSYFPGVVCAFQNKTNPNKIHIIYNDSYGYPNIVTENDVSILGPMSSATPMPLPVNIGESVTACIPNENSSVVLALQNSNFSSATLINFNLDTQSLTTSWSNSIDENGAGAIYLNDTPLLIEKNKDHLLMTSGNITGYMGFYAVEGINYSVLGSREVELAFGDNGFHTVATTSNQAETTDLFVDSYGRSYLVVTEYDSNLNSTKTRVLRYLNSSTGKQDSSFGNTGEVVLGSEVQSASIHKGLVDSQNRILLAGSYNGAFALYRLKNDELVVEEPVVEDPVVQDPVVQDPVVQDPVVEDPVVQDPVVENPNNNGNGFGNGTGSGNDKNNNGKGKNKP